MEGGRKGRVMWELGERVMAMQERRKHVCRAGEDVKGRRMDERKHGTKEQEEGRGRGETMREEGRRRAACEGQTREDGW